MVLDMGDFQPVGAKGFREVDDRGEFLQILARA